MKTCKPLPCDVGKCMVCKDRPATVLAQVTDPFEANLVLCAFCAGFPEGELVGRLFRKEVK